MNILEKIIAYLSYKLPSAPMPFGWFHFMFLFLTIIVAIIVALKFRHLTVQQNKKLIFIFIAIFIVLETYKQLVFSCVDGNWDYQWYIFPFQFCSVPIYIILIIAFIKDGKLKDYLFAFLGTYGLFAGLVVMVYPMDVFTNTLGVSIQTMLHHGSMLVLGVYCLSSGKVKLEHRSLIKATTVFVIILAIAFLLNYAFRNLGETFNMFFIDPQEGSHLPILSTIQKTAGYLPFIIAYILGFALVAYIVLLTGILINKLTKKSI